MKTPAEVADKLLVLVDQDNLLEKRRYRWRISWKLLEKYAESKLGPHSFVYLQMLSQELLARGLLLLLTNDAIGLIRASAVAGWKRLSDNEEGK